MSTASDATEVHRHRGSPAAPRSCARCAVYGCDRRRHAAPRTPRSASMDRRSWGAPQWGPAAIQLPERYERGLRAARPRPRTEQAIGGPVSVVIASACPKSRRDRPHHSRSRARRGRGPMPTRRARPRGHIQSVSAAARRTLPTCSAALSRPVHAHSPAHTADLHLSASHGWRFSRQRPRLVRERASWFTRSKLLDRSLMHS